MRVFGISIFMFLRSNLSNLVSRVDGSLSSRDSSSHHQTRTVGLLALCLEGAHHFLETYKKREAAKVPVRLNLFKQRKF